MQRYAKGQHATRNNVILFALIFINFLFISIHLSININMCPYRSDMITVVSRHGMLSFHNYMIYEDCTFVLFHFYVICCLYDNIYQGLMCILTHRHRITSPITIIEQRNSFKGKQNVKPLRQKRATAADPHRRGFGTDAVQIGGGWPTHSRRYPTGCVHREPNWW